MKYKIPLLILVVLSGCASVKKDKALQSMPPDTPTQNIHITARQFEYTPDIIYVRRGTHVIIEIESLDVTHGFKIDTYGINVLIPEKKTITVEFYARKPGIYPFRCSHFCGIGHLGMKGKLIVE